MKRLFIIILVIIAVVTIVGAGVYAYFTFTYPGLFNSIGTSALPCPSGATAASGQTHFTLIIMGQGFNGSKYAATCPLLSVTKGQSITIHLINNDRESHGIAVSHYLTSGVVVQPGQSRDITFAVDQ